VTDSELGSIVLTGVGATMFTDLWCLVRQRVLTVPFPNYRLVGRWMGHMTRGRLFHDSIASAMPVSGESAIGWITHYLIGIAFALVLSIAAGPQWFQHPTLAPALLVGIGTVVAPFFVMQPAMGAGIAASRTPRPSAARFHSLVMHAMFGIGLYVTARG
jgi:Protein of unknown function (DUF2938)